MDMGMYDGLAGGPPVVDPNVETVRTKRALRNNLNKL